MSLALTIAIIGTGSGINTLANSVNDGKNSQKAVDNKVTVVKELTDERTENSNTYLLSDGSKKTELFLSNIRYEKDGQLKDYENEIVDIGKNVKKSISTYGSGDKSSYKYVNKSSDNKAYFSDDIEDGIMLSHGKYILKMIPVIEEENDSILMWNGERCEPEETPVIETYEDHRMAMAFAPAIIRHPNLLIANPQVVTKSYPGYWEDLKQAGFQVINEG